MRPTEGARVQLLAFVPLTSKDQSQALINLVV